MFQPASKQPRRAGGVAAPGTVVSYAEVKHYLSKREIPQLFESLMAGLMYHRPENHIGYLQSCLDEIHTNTETKVHWSTFVNASHRKRKSREVLPPLPAPSSESRADSRGGGSRQSTPLPPISARTSSCGRDGLRNTYILYHNPPPVLAKPKVPVVCVLGGLGAEVDGLCARAVGRLRGGVVHLSTGGMLRTRMAVEGFSRAAAVPACAVVDSVLQAMAMVQSAAALLVAGFPRNRGDIEEYRSRQVRLDGAVLVDFEEEALRRFLRATGSVRAADEEPELERYKRDLIAVAEYFDDQELLSVVMGDQDDDDTVEDLVIAIDRIVEKGEDGRQGAGGAGALAPTPPDGRPSTVEITDATEEDLLAETRRAQGAAEDPASVKSSLEAGKDDVQEVSGHDAQNSVDGLPLSTDVSADSATAHEVEMEGSKLDVQTGGTNVQQSADAVSESVGDDAVGESCEDEDVPVESGKEEDVPVESCNVEDVEAAECPESSSDSAERNPQKLELLDSDCNEQISTANINLETDPGSSPGNGEGVESDVENCAEEIVNGTELVASEVVDNSAQVENDNNGNDPVVSDQESCIKDVPSEMQNISSEEKDEILHHESEDTYNKCSLNDNNDPESNVEGLADDIKENSTEVDSTDEKEENVVIFASESLTADLDQIKNVIVDELGMCFIDFRELIRDDGNIDDTFSPVQTLELLQSVLQQDSVSYSNGFFIWKFPISLVNEEEFQNVLNLGYIIFVCEAEKEEPENVSESEDIVKNETSLLLPFKDRIKVAHVKKDSIIDEIKIVLEHIALIELQDRKGLQAESSQNVPDSDALEFESKNERTDETTPIHGKAEDTNDKIEITDGKEENTDDKENTNDKEENIDDKEENTDDKEENEIDKEENEIDKEENEIDKEENADDKEENEIAKEENADDKDENADDKEEVNTELSEVSVVTKDSDNTEGGKDDSNVPPQEDVEIADQSSLTKDEKQSSVDMKDMISESNCGERDEKQVNEEKSGEGLQDVDQTATQQEAGVVENHPEKDTLKPIDHLDESFNITQDDDNAPILIRQGTFSAEKPKLIDQNNEEIQDVSSDQKEQGCEVQNGITEKINNAPTDNLNVTASENDNESVADDVIQGLDNNELKDICDKEVENESKFESGEDAAIEEQEESEADEKSHSTTRSTIDIAKIDADCDNTVSEIDDQGPEIEASESGNKNEDVNTTENEVAGSGSLEEVEKTERENEEEIDLKEQNETDVNENPSDGAIAESENTPTTSDIEPKELDEAVEKSVSGSGHDIRVPNEAEQGDLEEVQTPPNNDRSQNEAPSNTNTTWIEVNNETGVSQCISVSSEEHRTVLIETTAEIHTFEDDEVLTVSISETETFPTVHSAAQDHKELTVPSRIIETELVSGNSEDPDPNNVQTSVENQKEKINSSDNVSSPQRGEEITVSSRVIEREGSGEDRFSNKVLERNGSGILGERGDEIQHEGEEEHQERSSSSSRGEL